MTLARVRTVFSGPQVVGGGVCDLHFFGSGGDEQTMVDAVATFWTSLADHLHDGNFADVDPAVVNFNEANGDIVTIVTVANPPAQIEFSNQGTPLPPANQGLIRWQTNTVFNNRQLKGRTFIPCVEEEQNDTGGPTAAFIAEMQAAGDALIADEANILAVWHRPNGATAGGYGMVQSCSPWSKFAVLRSRRD